ncbi:MAG: DNA-processing protein DprA [Spirochaetota bacterium]
MIGAEESKYRDAVQGEMEAKTDTEGLVYLLMFNRVTNFKPGQKIELLRKYGTARKVFSNTPEISRIYGKPFKINGRGFDPKKQKEHARRELEYYRTNGIKVLELCSRYYPVRLKYIYDPPVVLFAMGKLEVLNNGIGVGIVGARKPSNSSINLAYSTARELAGQGIVIVSGLALGIDYYAHKGALDGGGNTTAVLGSGINICYPISNRQMFERLKEQGLIITEFPLGTSPNKYNFPRRNRIISGISEGVVVVEASSSSGALITASYALEQARDVMAFPGRAGSEYFAGNNKLIKDGAFLVENAREIMSVLGIDPGSEAKTSTGAKNAGFSVLEQDILKAIGDDKVSIEEIEKILNRPVSKIVSTLMMLELKGAVVQYPGKIFQRV